jgi:hypothetical protein
MVESFGYAATGGYQIIGLEYNVCAGGKSRPPLLRVINRWYIK